MSKDKKKLAALQPLIGRVRTDITAVKITYSNGSKGAAPRYDEPLTEARLLAHLDGTGKQRGCYHFKPGEATVQVGVFDVDNHVDQPTEANPNPEPPLPWSDITDAAKAILDTLTLFDMHGTPFRSNGGKGSHIYIIWDTPQDAYSVRQLMTQVVRAAGFEPGSSGGVRAGKIEIFPKQDSVGTNPNKPGSMTFLPLGGKSVGLDPDTLAEIDPDQIRWTANDSVPLATKPERTEYTGPTGTEVLDDITLTELESALDHIPADDRSVWVAIGHALKNVDGGFDIWLKWSEKSSRFDYDDAILRWDKFEPEYTGYPAVFKHALALGWEKPNDCHFEPIEPEPGALPLKFAITQCKAFREAYAMDDDDFIDGVLPRAELAMIFAPSGAGKTFLTVDMLTSIARGVPWNGHAVEQGQVLYIAAESAKGLQARLNAYVRHYEIDDTDLPFYALDAAPNLLNPGTVKQLIADILALGPRGTFKIIAIDTLACSMPGDENSSAVMGGALAACKEIYRQTGAMVVLVHHTGKDASKGGRGWSGLPAACDAIIEVTRDGDRRVAMIGKQKEDEDGRVFGFKLKRITLGTTRKGKERSSCVVEYCDSWAETDDDREAKAIADQSDSDILVKLIDLQDIKGEAIATSIRGGSSREPFAALSIHPEYPRHLSKEKLHAKLIAMTDAGLIKIARRLISANKKNCYVAGSADSDC